MNHIEVMKEVLKSLEENRHLIEERQISALRRTIAEAEKDEPVAWRWETHNGYAYSEQHYEGEDGQPLYTHPQPRAWVGLTDEEIHNLYWMDGMTREDRVELIKDAEAKLKEKNT